MTIDYLILLTIFILGTVFLVFKYKKLKEPLFIGLNLISGGLALYGVEIADDDQPILSTALVAFLSSLIPSIVDSLLQTTKALATKIRQHKGLEYSEMFRTKNW